MVVSVIEFIESGQTLVETNTSATVIEILKTPDSVSNVVVSQSVLEIVREGGTVTNILWGYGFPVNPYEGMIWIDVT